MRNYNLVLILSTLLLIRVIVFSGTYVDAICLASLLSFLILKEYMEIKALESEVMVKVNEQEEKLKVLVEELNRVKSSSEGLKAVMNMTKR